MFNLADEMAVVTAKWSDLGFTGPARVRDLWEHADVGECAADFGAELEPHACKLLKITPVSK